MTGIFPARARDTGTRPSGAAGPLRRQRWAGRRWCRGPGPAALPGVGWAKSGAVSQAVAGVLSDRGRYVDGSAACGDPCGRLLWPGATLGAMPYLEPNPPKPQKKLLLIFCLMMAVPAAVAIVASVAARMG